MAVCVSQIRVKQSDGSIADVPCGRCGFCLSNRRKEWSFRLQKEFRYHENSAFLTLTYSDENLQFWDHINTSTGVVTAYPVLVKSDLQKFMKRVRHEQSKLTDKKIKYYAVGEYGSKTKRPHYHALLFGVDNRVDLERKWNKGLIDVGTVTNDSIDYITKYIVNKKDFKHFVVPPFSCISNGIGLQHFKDNQELYSKTDIVRGGRGYKQKMPRYYRDKMKNNRWLEKIKATKKLVEFEDARIKEIERLTKLDHKDAEAYMDERALCNSNKVLQKAKDNTSI